MLGTDAADIEHPTSPPKLLMSTISISDVNHLEWAGRILFGSNRRGALLVLGLAVLLGLGTWLIYPILGVSYWLMPASLVDWAFISGFLLLPAGVASTRAGLLASLWVNIPTHVVIGYHFYNYRGGGIVVFGYTGSRTADIILVSGLIAVIYGFVGYLLGTAIRWSKGRLALTKVSIN